MRQTHLITMVLIVLGLLVSLTPAQAVIQWDSDHDTAIIYPNSMTYVDRANPLVDYGSEDFLMVGDERGAAFTEPPDPTIYFNAINSKRTYLHFSDTDLQSVTNGYAITGATLNLYLTGLIDGAGTATTSDAINVRQVVSADSFTYMSALSWDAQADRGVSYKGGLLFSDLDFQTSGESLGMKQWEFASTGTGSIAGMIEGWADGSIANYGLVMENDFDGQWDEIQDAVKYTIGSPTQMNELVATFSKQEGNYPFLRVCVAPKVVPEPASMVLALVGAGVLKLASRRKKK